jgi:hypothetical protein
VWRHDAVDTNFAVLPPDGSLVDTTSFLTLTALTSVLCQFEAMNEQSSVEHVLFQVIGPVNKNYSYNCLDN